MPVALKCLNGGLLTLDLIHNVILVLCIFCRIDPFKVEDIARHR